jgi:hypothetical protein
MLHPLQVIQLVPEVMEILDFHPGLWKRLPKRQETIQVPFIFRHADELDDGVKIGGASLALLQKADNLFPDRREIRPPANALQHGGRSSIEGNQEGVKPGPKQPVDPLVR